MPSSPCNFIVIIALFIAALSVSGGTLLILELDQPFTGFIQISQGAAISHISGGTCREHIA